MQTMTKLPRQHGWRWWLVRLGTAVLLLMILFAAFTLLNGASAKTKLTAQNPPPGQLINVDGRNLHIHCQGSGSPTVIMESGLNDFSLFWTAVQPEVAIFTHVCVYDRAGLGWSEANLQPRTSAQMIRELHELLNEAKITAPYLLVGHSFGGVNMRLFAQQYPDKVVGLILVDSAHEEMFLRESDAFEQATANAVAQFNSLAGMSRIGLLAMSPETIPDRGLSGEALRQYRAILATTDYFETAVAESEAFSLSLEEARQADIHLGDLPLIVLSRGLPEPFSGMSAEQAASFEQSWQQMQQELLVLSTKSQQLTAENSAHYIQLQQPDLVVSAIQEMWALVRVQK